VAGGLGVVVAQRLREPGYETLGAAVVAHAGRLPKEVTYLFGWIVRLIHDLLHPRPRFAVPPD
jgi:hypothetical protein